VARHAGDTGLVARFGGEEFCLLLPRLGETECWNTWRSCARGSRRWMFDIGNGGVLRMTVSIGAFRTRFPQDHAEPAAGPGRPPPVPGQGAGRNCVVAYG
jgi:GGDEF domain-containing protein